MAKNAFEVRSELLNLAFAVLTHNKKQEPITTDELVNTAKQLNDFVSSGEPLVSDTTKILMENAKKATQAIEGFVKTKTEDKK